MKSDSEPYQQTLILLESILKLDVSSSLIIGLIGLVIILTCLALSALFSSSENAFFSLSPSDLIVLNEENSPTSKIAIDLINEPDRKTGTRRLLATILIMNNLVNIFIVIYSSYLFERLFELPIIVTSWLTLDPNFIIQVVIITFILVLVGEIIPKIYATQNNLKIVRLMARPLSICYTVFKPFVLLLAGSSSLFDKYLKKRFHNISMEEISQAIDIADENKEIEEKHILKGIIQFGNTSVTQIMKPRTEVFCIDINTSAQDLLSTIAESKHSRIPVYEESFDSIKGILYIKDTLPYIHKKTNFNWHDLIRLPMFIPEHKKIDDLLEEFQEKRVHMAIVVDEYGGTSGIVTMEDILEEVFGEIIDEFDEEELSYSKLDEDTFIFEGKTALNDITKIIAVDHDYFDKIKGDAETLGGLVMEIEGKIPTTGQEIIAENITFTIESADNRKINRIKLHKNPEEIIDDEDE
ncbi:MAG: gliding motility-associated protein GldE [Bacteroidia bacterium]|nr:gliding motility-associated protein GldE [Bacteroidia bacterium]NNJ56601.1 gliding motility-associated protein GldE [Bacteroidia bacterium]